MSFWRKIINFIFWFSFAMCLIAVNIFVIMLFCNDEPGYAILLQIVGFIVLVPLFAFFGTFIELCNNIADIKKQMPKARSNRTVQQYVNAPDIQYDYYPVPHAFMMSQKQRAVNDSADVDNQETRQGDFWICSGCGTTNDNSGAFCSNCGKGK